MAHSAAGIDFDITTLVNSIVTGGIGQGSLTLPCGLIVKFGKNQGSGTGIDTITFTNPFSANGQCAAFVSVISTNMPAISNAAVYSLTNTTLRAKATNYAGTAYNNAYYYWFAVGV
jgi:acyl dehydratase